MKTSEALLELADKAWRGGALSADQVLALLRKVEWNDERYGAGEAMPTVEVDDRGITGTDEDVDCPMQAFARLEEIDRHVDNAISKPVKPE